MTHFTFFFVRPLVFFFTRVFVWECLHWMCASLFIQRDEFFIFLFRHFCHAHAHEHSVYKCTSVLLTVVVRKFKLLNFLFEHFWGNQMQLNRINALDIIKINKFSVLFCLFFLRIPHTAFSLQEKIMNSFYFILMMNWTCQVFLSLKLLFCWQRQPFSCWI